jgi:hypothetical protein
MLNDILIGGRYKSPTGKHYIILETGIDFYGVFCLEKEQLSMVGLDYEDMLMIANLMELELV